MREVSAVVGARRGSIMVYEDATRTLRTVAARGFDPAGLARSWTMRTRSPPGFSGTNGFMTYDPTNPDAIPTAGMFETIGAAPSSACRSVMPPRHRLRCVGVINLTDRIGGDRFTLDDRKLVSAVANQIGGAVENARLVDRDLQQQRLQRELELAHDLQLKLLPSPAVLQGDAEVAACRCLPADSVGGDFYTFSRLGRGRVGVVLGDVASHGFSAALVMALVLAAAGIHAGASPHSG